jgi:signal transduction histidine kinase
MVKVLVVEDDAVQMTLLTLLVEKHGHVVVSAKDGQKALEVVETDCPDIIISDINMPVMDGLALCTEIKSSPHTRKLPVLLVTATEDANDILRAMDAMADGYLTKPYDEEILTSTITRLLEQPDTRSDESFQREEPVDLSVDGQQHSVTAGRRQAIEMLMFAYRNAAIQTQALARSKKELEILNNKLTITIDNLAASEERYRGLVQTIPDIVYRLDRDGNFTFVNDAVRQLGYHQAELLGRHISTILFEEDIGHVSADSVLGQMLDTEGFEAPKLFDEQRTSDLTTASLEIRLKTETGEPTEFAEIKTIGSEVIYVEVNSTGLYGDESSAAPQYVGTVGVIRDISERRLAAKAADAAQQQAIAANKAKTEFLSGMSHELRTPLNAILGFGQLLDIPENPLNEDQLESVTHILDGGEHLLKLINEVLDLTKIESGQLSMSFEQINPYDAIKQCVDMTRNLCKAANVTLVNEIDQSSDLWFIADLTRFKQVCLNLLSNAAKYNNDGGTITVRGERIEDIIRFTIEDTGRGIPVDRQHEIFTPFHRLGAEKEDVEGTGIGLTISRELIEKMQGRIGFESEEGVGSSFWMELPVSNDTIDPSQPEPMPHAETQNLTSVLTELRQEKTILYIEDNPTNVALMRRIISRSPKVKLFTAVTAEEGLKHAEDIMPDLILMDINLPGMSGIEAKYALAASPATRDIPVVAVSANVMDEEVAEAMKSGMLHYIKKPVNVVDTWKIILDVFNRKTALRK